MAVMTRSRLCSNSINILTLLKKSLVLNLKLYKNTHKLLCKIWIVVFGDTNSIQAIQQAARTPILYETNNRQTAKAQYYSVH